MEKEDNNNIEENDMNIEIMEECEDENDEKLDKIQDLPIEDKCYSGYVLKNNLGNKTNSTKNYPEEKQSSRYSPVDFKEFFPIKHMVNNVNRVCIISLLMQKSYL